MAKMKDKERKIIISTKNANILINFSGVEE